MKPLKERLLALNKMAKPFGGSLEVLKQNIKKPDY